MDKVFCSKCMYFILYSEIGNEECEAPRETYYSENDSRPVSPGARNMDNDCAYFVLKHKEKDE